jgi:hypothetical protein
LKEKIKIDEDQEDKDIKRKMFLSDFSIADRWGPLVNNPSGYNLSPPNRLIRTIASIICLVLMFLFLWIV